MPSSARFHTCHAITAKWEGGWSNHPDDPGGATNYGVIQATYNRARREWGMPTRSVRHITHEEALSIFLNDYWLAVGADKLPVGVDLCGYDGAVNSGVRQSKRWLERSAHITEPVARVKNLCKQRLAMLQRLKTWKSFGRGWTNRVVDIEARGVKMALEAANVSAMSITEHLSVEAGEARRKASSAGQAATGIAVPSATTGVVAPTSFDLSAFDAWASAVLALGAVALIGLCAVLVISSRTNRARAAAYQNAASTI